MAKNLEIPVLPLIVIVVIIGLAYLVASGSVQLPFALTGSLPEGCQMAKTEKGVIECRATNFRTVSIYHDEKIDLISASGSLKITAYIPATGLAPGTIMVKDSSGKVICDNFQVLVGTDAYPDCVSGSYSMPESPATYTVIAPAGFGGSNGGVKVQYQERNLYYSDPSYGSAVQIDNTDGCSSQNLLSKLISEPEKQSTPVGTSGTVNDLTQIGKTVAFVVGYQPTVPMKQYTYNGQAVRCDFGMRQVYSLDKLTTLSGCWYGDSAVLLSGTSQVECCDPSNCQISGGSINWTCQNFKCVEGSVSDKECTTDATCQTSDRYISTVNGVMLVKNICNSNGKCEQQDVKIVECDPSVTYANDQVCICTGDEFNAPEDVTCKLQNKLTVEKDCTATFGADSCCAAGSGYTVKLAPEGKECCDVIDGVGTIKDSCGLFSSNDWLKNIGQWLSDLFGINGLSDQALIIIGAIVLVIIVIIIIWLILQFTGGLGGLKGGFGGGGTISQPIIIIK